MKNWILSLVMLALVLVLSLDAEARGRRGGCGPNGCQVAAPVAVQHHATVPHDPTSPVAVQRTAVAPVPSVMISKEAHAELHNRDAQGVANMMAARNYVGHFGGNPGYEGCGMAGTKQGAYNICCYGNSGMQTVDVGYAKGRNGMWFCCRRYR